MSQTLDDAEAKSVVSKQSAALFEFCRIDETVPIPAPRTFKDTMAEAQRMRDHIAMQCQREVCGVCAIAKNDTKKVRAASIPNLELLLADGPRTPEAPRDALTTSELDGKRYCVHPKGVSDNNILVICATCMQALKTKRIPPNSLVCIDPGERPAGNPDPDLNLEPLTFIEERLVSIYRTAWKIVFIMKPPGSNNLPPSCRQKCAKGHVIAFPNPTPDDLAGKLLRHISSLAQDLQVIFLNYATEGKDIEKLAQTYPALKVRGRVCVKWALHLCKVGMHTCVHTSNHVHPCCMAPQINQSCFLLPADLWLAAARSGLD